MGFLKWAALAVSMLGAPCAEAADIKIVPADFIVLNPTNPDKGYSDLMVHAVVIVTGPHETRRLQSLKIDVMAKGAVVLTHNVSPDEMAGTSQYLGSAPFPLLVQGQVLNANGLNGLFGRDVAFASSAQMAPSQALIAARLHFSVGFTPDAVRATAMFADGTRVAASIPVHPYASPIAYRMPLAGQWLMQAIPGVQSHHRFNPSTEFAVDFFKLGPDGHLAHGDPLDAKNFYGFGAPVLAAADGTVAVVISDQTQDRAAMIRKPGEALDIFLKRIDDFHMMTMAKNFRAANAGNLVTIRHEANGTVEYSSYGHLKSGSVRVNVGDVVKQGQVIGEVGDTGDSPAVHLHFQINTCADAFTCKSLPATFTDMHAVDGNDEMGRLVTTEPDEMRY